MGNKAHIAVGRAQGRSRIGLLSKLQRLGGIKSHASLPFLLSRHFTHLEWLIKTKSPKTPVGSPVALGDAAV